MLNSEWNNPYTNEFINYKWTQNYVLNMDSNKFIAKVYVTVYTTHNTFIENPVAYRFFEVFLIQVSK